MKWVYAIGTFMVFGLKLQGYFLIKTLMGGIVFGFFPSLLELYRLMQAVLEKRDLDAAPLTLKRGNKREFWLANGFGYLFLVVFTLLLWNHQVARNYLFSPAFYFFNLAVMALALGTGLYLIPLIAKYELPARQYLFQAFLCGALGIFESVAIVLGVALLGAVGFIVPPIGFFLGIPLLMLPYVWFSLPALARFERVIYKSKEG